MRKLGEMVLVCGMSGCGKTAFSRRFEEAGYIRFSPDDFYERVNGDAANRGHVFEAWNAMFQAIHEAELAGRDCVVDTNALTAGRRSEFLDWFPLFGRHRLVYIDADGELCRKNNRLRQRVIPDDVLDEMERELVPVSRDEDPRWDVIECWRNNANMFGLVWAESPVSS